MNSGGLLFTLDAVVLLRCFGNELLLNARPATSQR